MEAEAENFFLLLVPPYPSFQFSNIPVFQFWLATHDSLVGEAAVRRSSLTGS